MTEIAGNPMNDLWMLPKCLAVTGYIVMAGFLLSFDSEISKSHNCVTVAAYFAVICLLACNYCQLLRKLKLYERILEDLSSSSFSTFKNKELYSLHKLPDKSRVRRLSYPITSVEYKFCHPNWEHMPQNGLLKDNLCKLKSDTKMGALNKPVRASCKVHHEIPAKLHKCVKDLDGIIQRVKLLNLDYSKILEDTSVVNQNSDTVAKNRNLKRKFSEDTEDVQQKLECTNYVNEISHNMENPSMKNWSPLKDLDSVIQRIKSLNQDYIRNLEDTANLKLNSEAVTENENLRSQSAKEEEDIQLKLESIKCTKEISTVKSNGFLPQATHHGLDTKDKPKKKIGINYTKNLHDTSNVNQNSEIVTKNENLRNQIAKEDEDIQLESKKCTKKISSTVKSTGFPLQATHHGLYTEDKLTRKTEIDHNRSLKSTTNVKQYSDTVTKNKNRHNQITKEEDDIQRKFENKKCTKKISSTVKSPGIPLQATQSSLHTNYKLAKKTKSEFTSSAVKRNIVSLVRRRDLGIKDKLSKILVDPKNTTRCLLASILEHEASLRTAKKFIRYIIYIKVNKYLEFLLKFSLHEQDNNRLNYVPNLEQMCLILYKTISSIKHNTEAVVSLKKPLRKIPMRPYVMNVSFTPHMRELSRKRYDDSLSMREPEIRKNNQKILRDIRINSKFLPTYQTKHHGISVTVIPSSFQRYLLDFVHDPSIDECEILN